jgi:MscS family membrane protein
MIVGATYDTPGETLNTFTRRLREVLLEQPKVDPADVYVGLNGFGASSIDIELLFHLKVFDYAAQVEAQHKIILDIIALAEELGVEFAFPTRTIHVAGDAQVPQLASQASTTGSQVGTGTERSSTASSSA